MMVGEHDWYLDMGEKWRELFGSRQLLVRPQGRALRRAQQRRREGLLDGAEADADGAHADRRRPRQRHRRAVHGRRTSSASGSQRISPSVPADDAARRLLALAALQVYRPWNFWTDDAEQVQAILKRFNHVTVIHGHTHQLLTNRIGNIDFHGMLSTAWPWPYAPQGLPALTCRWTAPIRSIPTTAAATARSSVHPDGLVDKVYNLWNRNPVTVSSALHDVERQGRTVPREAEARRATESESGGERACVLAVIRTGAVAAALGTSRALRSRRARLDASRARGDCSATARPRRRSPPTRRKTPRARPEDRRRADGAVARRRTRTVDWVAEESATHARSLEPRPTTARSSARCRARPTATSPSKTCCCGRPRPSKSSIAGSQVFHSGDELGSTIARLVRHVPPARRQHAPRDLPEVPGAARPRRAAARHDQLVHRAPRARQAARAPTIPACARWRRTSPPSARASRSTTASR